MCVADRKFTQKKNRDDAIRVLSIVIDTLNRKNIRYYLDFGTLIGAVREKGLIPWDDDIDISLIDEGDFYKIPEVLRTIRKEHWLRTYIFTFMPERKLREIIKRKIKDLCGMENEPIVPAEDAFFTQKEKFRIAKVRTNKFLVFGRGNTCIDIFFKYKYNKNSCWMAYGKVNYVPLKYMSDDLVEIDFCGLKCMIPQSYNEYLTYKYGDWQTPQEDWSHELDDFSVNNR